MRDLVWVLVLVFGLGGRRKEANSIRSYQLITSSFNHST